MGHLCFIRVSVGTYEWVARVEPVPREIHISFIECQYTVIILVFSFDATVCRCRARFESIFGILMKSMTGTVACNVSVHTPLQPRTISTTLRSECCFLSILCAFGVRVLKARREREKESGCERERGYTSSWDGCNATHSHRAEKLTVYSVALPLRACSKIELLGKLFYYF